MSDPKPVFDYFRNMLISGFLVHYGIYLFNRDTWPVHDYLGPTIAFGGLALYLINGAWGWINIRDSLSLNGRIVAKIFVATTYIAILAMLLDAVVHLHHLNFI